MAFLTGILPLSGNISNASLGNCKVWAAFKSIHLNSITRLQGTNTAVQYALSLNVYKFNSGTLWQGTNSITCGIVLQYSMN